MAREVAPAGSFYPAHPGQPEASEAREATEQILFVFFKWRHLIFGVFLVFTVAAGIAMWMKAPVRSATAEILIKLDRLPLQISGLAARNEKNQVTQIMNSEVQLIRSRQVLSAAALKLLTDPKDPDKKIENDELEAKIDSLAENTSAAPLPDSNVLEVTYFAETGEEAERTLGVIIDEYIEKQATIQSGSTKLLKFFEQEKQRVEDELRAAEKELNDWQGKNQTVSISQQIASQLNLLEDRRKHLQQTDAQLEATQAKIAILKNELSAQPERLVMGTDQVANPLVSKLREQLLTAESSLQDLTQRFTEKHRLVQEKEELVVFLKKELAAADENIIGRETTGLNPLRETLKQQYAEAQGLFSSLLSQKQIVGKQVQEASDNLGVLREKKVKIDELSRLVDLNKDAFMLYGKKLEEGRIATGLGKEQLANVALIGAAHASGATDFNKRVRMVFLSAFVGLAVGMAIAFGLEFFNNALRTGHDVEHHLGLPLLATIPELPPPPAMLSHP
jgi:uncharacterized protein involved in exopolysaccharide biosynthesis